MDWEVKFDGGRGSSVGLIRAEKKTLPDHNYVTRMKK